MLTGSRLNTDDFPFVASLADYVFLCHAFQYAHRTRRVLQ
jgi:hypothetical protein